MIEEVILSYLERTLDVPVYLEQPEEQIEKYVLLMKTGSSRKNYINHATVVFQSYADSMYNAAKLNENVKNAMDSIIYKEDISKAALNSDYPYTDTTKKRYRYQAVYDLTY